MKNHKQSRRRKKGFFLFFILFLFICAAGLSQTPLKERVIHLFQQDSTTDITPTQSTDPVTQKGNEDDKDGTGDDKQLAPLTVHFLDVGQGDCIVLECDGRYMMIDAGDNEYGMKIVTYLKQFEVSDLDYVIGTHPDSDHYGGLDVILYKYICGTVILPNVKKETKTYLQVEQAIKEIGYQVTYPVPGTEYQFADAKFQIIAPNGSDYDNTNDYSVAIVVTHGENRFLFAGDAEEESEAQMLASGYDLSADVYKVSHHGSRTSTTEEFIEAVSPDFAVILCGEGNDYGHPHSEVLNRLRAHGIKLFRTDEQGTITVQSDGSNLIWNCQPSETWQAGE